MPEYVIIKGMPMPTTGPHNKRRFPFEEMEIGDRFYVPQTLIKETAARVQCSSWSKRLGRRFRVARHDDEYAVFWRES